MPARFPRAMEAQGRRGMLDEFYRENEKWNGGKKEWTIMRHRLAEGAIHRIVVSRRLAGRMVDGLGDGGRGGVMDMGLGDVGLQGERDQDQAGDEVPARTSFLRRCDACLRGPSLRRA